MSQESSSSFPSRHKPRKHHRAPPPPRLSWPSSLGKSSLVKKPSASKRPRVSYNEGSVTMWVDKYSPKSSSDLCVAPKKVKEVKLWLEDSTERGSNKKLLVLVGSPGIGKSAMVRILSKELNFSLMTWNESYVPRVRGQASSRDVFTVEQSSAIDSFREFLQQSGAGFSSLHLSNDNKLEPRQKSIILLEDLPNLHGLDTELRFREIMHQHLHRSRVPTVLIFSDVSEGKHRPDDLERLINREELYSSSTTILQIHPVTKPKMKKVLDKIAKQQNCQVTPTQFEELHHQSRGDIRHAIMTLQLHSTGNRSLGHSSTISHNDRDVKLSTFRALGKLLYAKRTEKDGRSVLAFDPEEILERSDLGINNSLRFLEYHSVDFFSDIIELSDAFSLFSDAATLLDNPLDRYHGDSGFPEGCASSIAGRSVARTNTRPTPNKFRQFSTPKIFDVIRNRRQNQVMMDRLSRRLASSHLSVSGTVGCTNTFVTEMLPAMRIILPNEVNPSVENLFSVARETRFLGRANVANKKEDTVLREQVAILEMDDIVDSDSEDEAMEKSNQDLVVRGSKEAGPRKRDSLNMIDKIGQEGIQLNISHSTKSEMKRLPEAAIQNEIIVIDD